MIKTIIKTNNKQNGAAAIFIVVFFAILISVIALSFLRVALDDQQQAINNDLSRSAYDSADAGLEDAKRALSWYRVNCPPNNAPLDEENCAVYNKSFDDANRCNLAELLETNTLPGSQRVGSTSEVRVSTDASTDQDFDQAYTCVTITTDTEDYRGIAKAGEADTIIPLRTVNNKPIDTIELNWFLNKDPQLSITPPYPTPPDLPVPTQVNWSTNTPPIMRFQLIPVLRSKINIDNIDNDAKTLFLYPHPSGAASINLSNNDIARTYEKSTAPNRAQCQETVEPDNFACSVRITQLNRATGGNASNTDYYLRITSHYNNADYQVRLFGNSGNDLRLFDNVEPKVDSTGRANDVFRRVESRVRDIPSSNPLKDGGFDITKGLCKSFTVPNYSSGCPAALIEPVDPSP